MDFLTENLLLNIGGMGLAAVSLFVIWFVIKKFAKAISEFNKILGNHLHDASDDKKRDIESREKNTQVLQKLCDKIDLK